ncbi:MAG: response regulator [Polyangia bacterium]|jgi:CheY-like chemotaxis protein|nr:response regulator [Polyangia bacterium]
MRGSVFVVEDDLDVAEFYALLFQVSQIGLWGMAHTGREAVRRYLAARVLPDVVLLDHRLPDFTGLEVAKRIRERHPGAVIVLVTADDSAAEPARAMGIRRIKHKPVENAYLLRNLSGAIAEAQDLGVAACHP